MKWKGDILGKSARTWKKFLVSLQAIKFESSPSFAQSNSVFLSIKKLMLFTTSNIS